MIQRVYDMKFSVTWWKLDRQEEAWKEAGDIETNFERKLIGWKITITDFIQIQLHLAIDF